MTEIVQGSAEWHEQRLGKVTASRVADVIAKTKSGYSASRDNYMAQLICERMTGRPTEGFSSAAMQHGTDTEPKAREAYESLTFTIVEQVAMIDHPTIAMTGASPDGQIGEDGLIEIKCPNTNTHIETLLSQKVPTKYVTQMMWQMACTGRQWCDFVSYDPRMPEGLQIFIKRVDRDNELIKQLEDEIVSFLSELDSKVEALNNLKG